MSNRAAQHPRPGRRSVTDRATGLLSLLVILALVVGIPAALIALRGVLGDLEKKLPPELAGLPDAFAFDDPASYRAALADVERRLLPELLGAGEEPA